MNKRDNLLSLLRRTGYESVPVHFDMCPELAAKMENLIDRDEIGIPWENICDSRLVPAAREAYEGFYTKLQPGRRLTLGRSARKGGVRRRSI